MPTTAPGAWQRLDLYRQRYQIEDRLAVVDGLVRSIRRREARLRGVRNHVEQLEGMLAESRRELEAISREIAESRRVGALLIEEIIDQVRVDYGEAWTPRPVRGFRVWTVEENALVGAKLRWPTPRMEAVCLMRAPGDDIPHTGEGCGLPPCGIYAAKRLEFFDREDGRSWLDGAGAIGVVAMTGKVVEHEAGYRCAAATVEALYLQVGAAALLTDDPNLIAAVFANPVATVEGHGRGGWLERSLVKEALTRAREKEEMWT